MDTLKVGVGFPHRWRDYSGLEIVKGDARGAPDYSSSGINLASSTKPSTGASGG
ncbi:MAG TPA: hypothetical protein VN924_16715 [Bryobacteraceae bacterium]|nr:hypothetical protein [Bryobacteraceae bacterium]